MNGGRNTNMKKFRVDRHFNVVMSVHSKMSISRCLCRSPFKEIKVEFYGESTLEIFSSVSGPGDVYLPIDYLLQLVKMPSFYWPSHNCHY